jgi:hypothetical protein
MLFHLFGTKELRSQRRRITDGLRPCEGIAAQSRPQAGRVVAYAFAA